MTKVAVATLLALLLSAAAATESSANGLYQDCTYTTSDGSNRVVLSYLTTDKGMDNWMETTDELGRSWYFNPCIDNTEIDVLNDQSDGPYEPCPTGSSVCMRDKSVSNESQDRGTTASALASDSPYGIDQGVELEYGAVDLKAQTYKTLVEYVYTDGELQISIKLVDETYTIITVHNPLVFVFPNVVADADDGMADGLIDGSGDMPWSSETASSSPLRTPMILLITGATLVVFGFGLCICGVRRAARKRAVAKQFSNIAFQPIPTNKIAVHAPANYSFAPTFNPYIAEPQQSQFLYYYPAQQQQAQEAVADANIKEDEKLAIELQSKFDAEAAARV
eukprot:TRINITY_DN544_c0_g1_i1.p1 TRINITY_DN544_c0_g1~~TRINITY_DN544_c0_g1_i1.p1  ORF type:complete len:336 (+),score=72.85 TRINITY_DN544_c0_g1_i1:108-1115(+)